MKRCFYMNKKLKTEAVDHLFQAILTLKSTEECYSFFEDVCTVNELLSFSQRYEVAKMLRGKNKANFTPHVDCGDNVIIINADKVELTGNKWTDRVYYSYSGYPGGQKSTTPAVLMQKSPDRFFRKVIKGMLPKNRLGAAILKNLYVYAGSEHPHQAQQPKQIDINTFK